MMKDNQLADFHNVRMCLHKRSCFCAPSSLGLSILIISYSVRQNKYPLKFFAIFLATARNFYMKFQTLISHS